MTRAHRYLAVPALLGLSALGCIDTPLSLGHHQAAPLDDADGAPPLLDASMMTPVMMTGGGGGHSGHGGEAGQAGMLPGPIPDAGEPPADAALPALGPCEERASWTAELECAVSDGFFGAPGSRPPPPMSTTATLTFDPVRARQGVARASGELAFEAWGATFAGRIDGELDCTRGTFRALILDGQVTSPGTLPGPFFGELNATLDGASAELTGVWWHGPDPQAGPRCTGTWLAMR